MDLLSIVPLANKKGKVPPLKRRNTTHKIELGTTNKKELDNLKKKKDQFRRRDSMIAEMSSLKISRIDEIDGGTEKKDKAKTEPRRGSMTSRRGSLASLLGKMTAEFTTPLNVRRRSVLQRQDTSKVELKITSRPDKPKLQRRNTSTVEMQIQARGKSKRRHSLICGADQLESPDEPDPMEEATAQEAQPILSVLQSKPDNSKEQPWLSVLAMTKMDLRKKVGYNYI